VYYAGTGSWRRPLLHNTPDDDEIRVVEGVVEVVPQAVRVDLLAAEEDVLRRGAGPLFVDACLDFGQSPDL